MILSPTPIDGVVVVESEQQPDDRGWFARIYSLDEFTAGGIDLHLVECSASFNARRGTLRGLHFQAEPAPEPKLVRCTRGRMFDVAVDLRPDSATYCQWFAVELDPDHSNALFLPPGCAHGFLTLEDETEVSYAMGERYVAELARGVRWNDPAFGIEWPFVPTIISPRDAGFPDFRR